MAISGMDLTEAPKLATAIGAEVKAISQVIINAGKLVENSGTVWVGPDQVDFASNQWNDVKKKLNDAMTALTHAQTTITNNVKEQSETSTSLGKASA